MQKDTEEMQIDQEEDVGADEGVQGVKEEAHHNWASCKEMKPRNKSFKNAFTFPLCLPVYAAKDIRGLASSKEALKLSRA